MKSCAQCKKDFEITDTDRAFYKKMDVPEPTQCPQCRMRRRLAFRNDKTLYNRKSSKSGKSIIAIYPEGTSFPVYDRDEWYADGWDPLSYGQPIDFSRPFFQQFREVRDRVPRINLSADSLCVGSPYVNGVLAAKNCHLLFCSAENEECYYGYRNNYSKNCVDNLFVNKCELCYECVEAYSSYSCRYSQLIASCTDSTFLYDCRSCTSCLFCVGLRNKSYCIFNAQYSKEEYEKRLKEYRLDSYESVEQVKKEFKEFLLKFPRRFVSLKNCEHVTGDNVQNSKNCTGIFDAVNCENVSHGQFVDDTRDSMDVNYCFDQVELHYEVEATGPHAHAIKFSGDVWPNASNLDYCDSCANSSNCFGCVGLRQKQYCILNKQYTKVEYETLKVKLIEHMKQTGEWGEFFPIEYSAFAYNESTAMMFFPMSREDVLANGWRWQDAMPGSFGKETIKQSDIPDSISDVFDTLCNEMLACSSCGRNYKIIKQELAFYRQTIVPIPRRCFDCRFADRIAQRNPTQLYHRQCMCEKSGHDHGSRAVVAPELQQRWTEAGSRCPAEFETTYAPDRPELVYCEQCYQKEVV